MKAIQREGLFSDEGYFLMKNKYLGLGILLGILSWLIESAMHVYLFNNGTLISQILIKNTHEILLRLAILILFSLFGGYIQLATQRSEKMKASLKQVKTELDQIFNVSADAISLIDKDFNLIRMNKAFFPLCTAKLRNTQEAIGQKCYDIYLCPLCHTRECPLVKILAGEEKVEYELEKVSKEGGRLWYLGTATPLRDSSGRLVGIVKNLKDITERKKLEEKLQKHLALLEQMVAERTIDLTKANEELKRELAHSRQIEIALRESEQRFRLAVKNTNELLYEWDYAEGRMKWFSFDDNFLGYNYDELFGNKDSWEKILHPEDRDRVLQAIDRHLKIHEPYFQVYRVIAKDGTMHFWSDDGLTIFDEQGQPKKWLGVISDITEQKEVEKLLSESENVFRMLFDEAKDAIFIIDVELGAIIKANKQAEKLLKKPLEEIIGLHQSALCPPGQGLSCDRVFREIKRKKSGFLIACEVMASDGQRVPVEISSSLLKLTEDKEVIQSIIHDISDREQAEKLLQKTEEQYQLFVKNFPGIAYQMDFDFRFEFLHGTVEDITGYKAEEIMAGKPSWDQILLPEDAAFLYQQVRDKFSLIPAYSIVKEVRIHHKKGGLRWLRFEIKNICDLSGRPRMVQGAIYNITDRKRIEESLAWEASINAALANLSKSLISTASIDEISSMIMDYAQKFTKSPLGFSTYLEPETGNLVLTGLKEKVFKMCDLKNKQLVFKEGSGLVGWVTQKRKTILTNDPSHDPRFIGVPEGHFPIHRYLAAPSMIKGKLIGQIAVANSEHDYTEQDRHLIERLADIYALAVHRWLMEEEKEKAISQLTKAQKLNAVGTLAGGLAHDFNNLLTTIIGNLSLLEVYLKTEREAFEILSQAQGACQHARDLTLQLLTFSSGGAPVKKTASISWVLKKNLAFALSGSKAKYDLSLPDNLWSVEIDEGQISQVINNLLINADQAMPQGGVIRIWAENVVIKEDSVLRLKEGKYVKVSFKDQGIGIAKEILPKIFEPYFSTKKTGSGLGLAISYSIITKHGGEITVDSTEGQGTLFCLYLPASDKEIFSLEKVEEGKFFGHGKILFMDDQKNIQDTVSRLLTHLGYQVDLAGEGLEAIELYQKAKESGQPFDLVILDLTIPAGLGGKETLDKLQEIDPEVRAIVTSGYSNDPIMSEYQAYGFQGVICKPFQVQELGKIIHEVMKERVK